MESIGMVGVLVGALLVGAKVGIGVGLPGVIDGRDEG